MKAPILFRPTMAVVLFVILMTATGCQTPGKVVSTKKSDVCPTCEKQTVTTPIKGMKYTKHVCPNCKTVYINDPSVTSDELADYMGMVHVCTSCKSLVVTCPQCRRQ